MLNFSKLVLIVDVVDGTSKRLQITDYVVNL